MPKHISVGAILVRAGTVLLGKRSPTRQLCPGVWDLVGGHVELGETPEDTLVRELQEELGITPRAFVKLHVLGDPQLPSNEHACHVFAVTEWDGEPRNRQPEEHTEIRWISFGDALRLELAHPQYAAIFARLAVSLPTRRGMLD